MANAFICKGDNGRWQPNYSSVLGNLAAGGISNLYYPDKDRGDAGLTLENGAIGIGATAAANLIQEFLIRKLTRMFRPRATRPNPKTGRFIQFALGSAYFAYCHAFALRAHHGFAYLATHGVLPSEQILGFRRELGRSTKKLPESFAGGNLVCIQYPPG